jgi:tetratricopeptide (TPR) repeat protein
VTVSGKYKGTTPLALRRLLVGKYDIALQKEGYKPVQTQLMCSKNSAKKYNATLSMTPQFAALQEAGTGDKHMDLGDFAAAITAYEKAVSLDPEQPAYGEKLNGARKSLMVKRIQNLLSSYKYAYDTENTVLLSSLLNEGMPDFLSTQVSNADKLFQEFEDIDMTLTDIKISGNNQNEAFVRLHIKIGASFAETGMSVDLLEADQMFTIRKLSEAEWKICEIE